uniref:NADH-ubiquinone oxidoreductase chain 4L n=1 Tax=Phascolosoma similis TaxID=2735967 RepID=A0A7D4VIU5_9ANNE|nr:NADH dehydrogenase subunit 4L [Phascolosoma similis]QKS32586.1 NADH dehydrogenase subunit 4L [Phascolosoma similis]
MFFSLPVLLTLFPLMGLTTLLLQRKQFLMSLLALEILALALTLLALISSTAVMYYMLIILPMAACEASVGLALLVNSTRQFGSDMLSNLTMSKW